MNDAFLDPLRLSRELGRVRAAVLSYEREAKRGVSALDPFRGQPFPGKTQYCQVQELPLDDSLRAPLLRHLAELISRRVQLPWTHRILFSIYSEPRTIQSPVRAELTLAEVRRRALVPGDQHRSWIATRLAQSAALVPLYKEYFQREPEIEQRLGARRSDLDPWDSQDEMLALARSLVELTNDALSELGYLDEIALQAALLRDASEGWPAQLSLQALLGTLKDKAWFRDVDFRKVVLPERLNPASFLIAFSELGTRIGIGLCRSDLPFVVARSPFDEQPLRLGMQLALAAGTTTFQIRRLGLSKQKAGLAERALAACLLCEFRRRAVRFVLTSALREGRQAFSELTPWACHALGCDEGQRDEVLGGLLRLDPSGIDFFAFADAARACLGLRDEFDVDWFDSPHALDFLRAEIETPPRAKTAVAPLRAAAERWVAEVLSVL